MRNCSKLIVCGWDEVFVLDLGRDPPPKVWSWRAADAWPDSPHLAAQFATTDECKPLDDGSVVLVTSSSGAAAAVGRETGDALFYAAVPNAHSIEWLPLGRVVVASSGSWGLNRLLLFDLNRPAEPLWSEELAWAHGAVWDAERETLWALGSTELRAYSLREWDTHAPSLERAATFELPDPGGHDLSPQPRTPLLNVTTGRRVWHFDRDAASQGGASPFAPHPRLSDGPGVKCVSVDPMSGRTAWVQAEGEHWWAERIRFLDPDGELHLPGGRIYKVRWDPAG